MKKPRSYLVNCALACAVLHYCFYLSRSGRNAIDWIVIGLVVFAILWNLFKLGQRLYRAGGGRDLWHLQRTLIFWIIGLFNTALIRTTEVGSWKNFVGWALLIVAFLDTVMLYRREQSLFRAASSIIASVNGLSEHFTSPRRSASPSTERETRSHSGPSPFQ